MCSPSTRETEAGGSLEPGLQFGSHCKTPSKEMKAPKEPLFGSGLWMGKLKQPGSQWLQQHLHFVGGAETIRSRALEVA